MLSTLILAGLAACGGGASNTDAVSAVSAEADIPDRTTSAAMSLRIMPIRAPVRREMTMPKVLDNAATVGSWRALAGDGALALSGVPNAPPVAAASMPTDGGRIFYIDSETGNDLYSGQAAAAGSIGQGPWRTLGRLMQASLRAGDTIQLACRSIWRETLRLPADGTTIAPIRVVAPANCSEPPAIDGSVAIASSEWSKVEGSIYRARLLSPPMALTQASGSFTEAHHPNRTMVDGVLSSPYLKLAADANAVRTANRLASTALPVGSDLVLPSGVLLADGARVRVRTEHYVIDESVVTGFSANSLQLATPTISPVRAGSGYYLLGQRWMLDSAGEWYFDANAGQLYAWMPDSAAPKATVYASTQATGIDLQNRKHVVLEGLTVRRVGLGLDLRRSTDVQLRNSFVEDISGTGINASASANVLIESNTLARIGTNAITGQGDPIAHASALVVRNNVIRDGGVLMLGEEVVGLPQRSLAAIVGATGAVITGNVLVNTGYIGILAVGDTLIQGNFVFGACSVLDDCAGIYTGGANNNSRIIGNTVLHSRGMRHGMTAASASTSAQGIYVDDQGTGVLIEGNSVSDTDFGIQLHNASANIVRGNQLYANRRGQLWLQEDTRSTQASGDLSGNVLSGNILAPTSSVAYGMRLSTAFSSIGRFATFTGNRYYDKQAPLVVQALTQSTSRTYDFSEWVAYDSGAWGASQNNEATYAVTSSNLLTPNAQSNNSNGGWYSWNATAPAGRLYLENCSGLNCLRYVAGGSAGVVSSPGFVISKDSWYRLTVTLATEQDEQKVPLVVRVGGGDYGSVSDRNLTITAGRSTKSYTQVFKATRTVDPSVTSNGSLKARVDIDGIEAGGSVSLVSAELVQVAAEGSSAQTVGLVNAGSTATSAACPFASSSPATCTKLYAMADNRPVSWPLALPAGSTTLLYSRN